MQGSPQALIYKALAAIIVAIMALLSVPQAKAQDGAGTALQPVPELTARVIDQTGTLTPGDLQSLSEQLKKLEDETGAQVAVLMVATTALLPPRTQS